MYEFIEGNIIEKTPTYIILETGNVGYFIHISLHTFTQLGDRQQSRLYIHQIVREDALILYGFFEKTERDVFRQLISVSGIGANTARLILSSLSPSDIEQAINEGNVAVLNSVKGIGAKTAQRIIVDLKGKITAVSALEEIFSSQSNTIKEEALSALVNLGFTRGSVEKTINQILKEQQDPGLEDLIKEALARL
jgi:Holliday junction DNA helicase RuvA